MRTHRHRWVWQICIPKLGSVDASKLTRADYEAHLLVQLEDGGGDAKTANGRLVKFTGSQVELLVAGAASGAAADRTVTVLFEELFFNSKDQSFRVVCVDGPLSGLATVVDTAPTVSLSTLDDFKAFLWPEASKGNSGSKRSRARIAGLYEGFVSEWGDVQEAAPHRVEVLFDDARELFVSGMQIILKDSVHKRPAKNSTKYMDQLKHATEGVVLDGLCDTIFQVMSVAFAADEQDLNKRTRSLQHLTADDMDVGGGLDGGLGAAVTEIGKINTVSTPSEKLQCLHKAIQALSTLPKGTEATLSADELVPLVALMVIRSVIPNWYTNLSYMCRCQFNDFQSEETNYLLTTLEAALMHIRHHGFTSPGISAAPSWTGSGFASGTPPGPGRSMSSDAAMAASGSLGPAISSVIQGQSSSKQFFKAVESGDVAEVYELLGESMMRRSAQSDALLCHPLCECPKCVELLEKMAKDPKTATVHSRNKDGLTALHVAAHNGDVDIINLLIERGGSVAATDYDERTPLHVACARDQVDCSLILLLQSADVNARDSNGSTPLHYCAARGHERCAKVLMWQAPSAIDVDAVDNYGNTALHAAAMWGFTRVLEMLVLHHAKRDVKNGKGQIALDCAQGYHTKELLRTTQPLPSSPTGSGSDDTSRGATPVQRNSTPALRPPTVPVPIGASGWAKSTDVLAPQPMRGSDMQPSAAVASDEPKSLLRRHSVAHPMGAALRSRPPEASSVTPARFRKDLELLFESVHDGDVEMLRFKLFQQTSRHDVDRQGCHPLCQCERCVALGGPQHRITATSANADGHTILHVAALHGVTDVARMLLENNVPTNLATNRQHIPLHFACQYNHLEVARLLIDADSDVDMCDHAGNTPLHFCASNGHAACAQLLVEHRADVDAINFRGDSALHNAAKWGYIELVSLLLSAGAMTELTNHRKRTPLQDTQNETIIALLMEAKQNKAMAREKVISGTVMMSEVDGQLDFLNGTYRQVGVLSEDTLASVVEPSRAPVGSRPVFDKTDGIPLVLYYAVERAAWAVARKIGAAQPLAFAAGDVVHPGLLSAAWCFLGDDAEYHLDFEAGLTNCAGLAGEQPPTVAIDPRTWRAGAIAAAADGQTPRGHRARAMQSIRAFDRRVPLSPVRPELQKDRSAPDIRALVTAAGPNTTAARGPTAAATAVDIPRSARTREADASTPVDAGWVDVVAPSTPVDQHGVPSARATGLRNSIPAAGAPSTPPMRGSVPWGPSTGAQPLPNHPPKVPADSAAAAVGGALIYAQTRAPVGSLGTAAAMPNAGGAELASEGLPHSVVMYENDASGAMLESVTHRPAGSRRASPAPGIPDAVLDTDECTAVTAALAPPPEQPADSGFSYERL